jgi:AraC-like DNA-binding protein
MTPTTASFHLLSGPGLLSHSTAIGISTFLAIYPQDAASMNVALVVMSLGDRSHTRDREFLCGFIRWLLERATETHFTLKEAARELGCAPITLQRHMQRQFGFPFRRVLAEWQSIQSYHLAREQHAESHPVHRQTHEAWATHAR